MELREARLGALATSRGYRLEVFDQLGSTSDLALSRGRSGESGPLWIVAVEQTRGRGRMARHWASPPGNLYASLLLENPAPQALSPQLGFVAGVALAEALNNFLPAASHAQIKWPNDLLIGGAKLAGVLIEGTSDQGRFLCSIGIGVNCASHPDHTPYPATHLADHAPGMTAGDLIAPLADSFARWIDIWAGGARFAEIRAAWMRSALPVGAPLRVNLGEGAQLVVQEGAFGGIDEHGRLLLNCADRVMTFDAGDVFPIGKSAPPELKRED